MPPNVNIFFQPSCVLMWNSTGRVDAGSSVCINTSEEMSDIIEQRCVHEGLMRLLLSHWFPSENVNVFIIHSAKVYPCDVKLRRRPFIVWDALQDLFVCYQSWHIEQGKPTCHSWKKKKKVELSVNLQPRCGILESGYISLVDSHHLSGNKGIDGNGRFLSFCVPWILQFSSI